MTGSEEYDDDGVATDTVVDIVGLVDACFSDNK
jgi:hypothetical protein